MFYDGIRAIVTIYDLCDSQKSAGVEKIYTQKKEFDRKKFQTNFFFERKNKFRTQNKSYEHFALIEF